MRRPPPASSSGSSVASPGPERARAKGTWRAWLSAPLPAEVLQSIQRNGVCLKGPVTTPIGTGFKSVNVRLRQSLDLYANLRPVKNLAGVVGRFEGVDLVVIRENTEDLYAGLEHV